VLDRTLHPRARGAKDSDDAANNRGDSWDERVAEDGQHIVHRIVPLG